LHDVHSYGDVLRVVSQSSTKQLGHVGSDISRTTTTYNTTWVNIITMIGRQFLITQYPDVVYVLFLAAKISNADDRVT